MFSIPERSDLLPNPFASERSFSRFHHRDLADLPVLRLRGELLALQHDLAVRVTLRRRPVILSSWPTIVDSHEWAIARIRGIRDELRRRSARRA